MESLGWEADQSRYKTLVQFLKQRGKDLRPTQTVILIPVMLNRQNVSGFMCDQYSGGKNQVASTVLCVKCDRPITHENINVSTDITKCDYCGNIGRLSDQINTIDVSGKSIYDFDQPAGVHFEKTQRGFKISATTRSKSAFFLVPFTAVWAGGSLGGLYGSQIAFGRFDLMQSLFGIPFLLGSIVLITFTLMSMFGAVRILADGYQGKVFVGLGPIGWSKKLDWRDISKVSEGLSSYKVNDQNKELIVLEGSKRITFGSQLTQERRYYIINILKILMRDLHK